MLIAASDWAGLVVPDGSLAESFARGSVVYFGVLVLFRVVLTRQTGAIGLPDVMLAVLASECVSNSLGADTKSVPNGLAALAGMLFWSTVLDRLAYRYGWVKRLLEPPPVELVRDGRVDREALRKQWIAEDDLAAQLRGAGVTDPAEVKLATLESEGAVTVVPSDPQADLRAAVRELQEAVRRLTEVPPPRAAP